MAISTKKKATENKQQEVVDHEIKVTRAKQLDNVIMFDVIVNGVTIYGCSYRTLTRKDNGEEFGKIGFPSRKGSDDKYYCFAWFKISEKDQDEMEKQIEALI